VSRPHRHRVFRRTAGVTLLTAAVIALSGCYTIYEYGDGSGRVITWTEAASNHIIQSCSAAPSCALDTIHDLCLAFDPSDPRIDEQDCSEMGSFGRWSQMRDAIAYIVYGSYDCLAFEQLHLDPPYWGYAMRGQFGCI
jgi:hypothetical protein